MKKKDIIIFIKFILYFLLLIYLLINFKNNWFNYTILFIIVFFIIDLVIYTIKNHNIKNFVITTDFGKVKISEKVIENIISLILRKFKIIRHYICQVYNKNNTLFILLNIETTLKNDDVLPEILATLKETIFDKINTLVGTVKPQNIEIIVDKIKRIEK